MSLMQFVIAFIVITFFESMFFSIFFLMGKAHFATKIVRFLMKAQKIQYHD